MGEKDITEKILEDHNDVFADIINGLIFAGEQRILPESLENTAVHSQYKADDEKVHELERDVAKYWKDQDVQLAICGIENQSSVEKYMPFRIIGYDGTAYRSQLQDKRKEILPVMTIVLYFGTEHCWYGKRNIKGLMKIPEGLDDYINDYKMQVFEVAWLTEEQISRFRSDFKIVANFFVQKRKNKDYIPDDPTEIKHIDEVLKLLQVMTGDEHYKEVIKKAFVDVIKANEYDENLSVRQTLFVDGFGSWGSEEPVEMFIAPIPRGKTSAEYNKKGLHCCVTSWRRISDETLSPRIKCGANYMNSRVGQREAIRNGYDTCIFLNEAGKVAEGPGSCLFIVKNDTLITPQLTDSVLESITRDSIIQIARKMDINVVERSIDRTELYTCDEAFLCGSAMEITPVLSIDRYEIGNSITGLITKNIHMEYLNVARGIKKNFKDWVTPIYAED